MKPIIGLTCSIDNKVSRRFNTVNYTYINAIIKAGGVPVIIPILEEPSEIDKYINMIDGLILTGGEDVSSLVFGENPVREVTQTCYERDDMEFALFNEAYDKGIPMVGICRGLQLANIALGGDIYQDIYSQVPDVLGHVSSYRVEYGHHLIDIKEDSILYDILGKETVAVNSLHHQSIRKLGKNLKISAKAQDGIVEAMESTNDKFFLGFQFHPEAMIEKNKEFLKIFERFIEECKK